MKDINPAPAPSGLIFNIQKFSLHDGPGIRTVVFFNGCPLRCRWCANPESQQLPPQILWHQDLCLHCETCVHTCPHGTISHTHEKDTTQAGEHSKEHGRIMISRCPDTSCDLCIQACPAHALERAGKRMTVSEVMTVCLQDLDFYEESGGGVTLSGGEAMMQPDFAQALLQSLKKEHIHTAIETTGYAAPAVFQKLCADLDLLLFDMKHWNAEKHKEGTGVDNALILENMKWAIESGKDVLPRLPVIPGYNDSLEDAKGFCERLRQVGADRIQLLPFHQFGEKKYDMLGRDYGYSDVPALHEEDLENFRNVFSEKGIHAFF